MYPPAVRRRERVTPEFICSPLNVARASERADNLLTFHREPPRA